MAGGAAFFDLDRTLLRGASGPIIGEALKSAGVTDRSIPGQQLIYRAYDLFGENRPQHGGHPPSGAASPPAGCDRRCRRPGRWRRRRSPPACQPFARPLFEEHRAAGRPLVLATTTPYDLVKPLADALGFDDVVATRYGERDGVYDGTLDGEFVWGQGKLRAIAEWAMENAVSLGDSWAYSDSYYDVPMLAAVKHPVVVNPDPRLAVVALAAPVAGGAPRRTIRCAQAPGGRHRAPAGPPAAGPSGAHPVRPVRHQRRGAHPRGGRGDRGGQPPQLLRPHGDGPRAGQARAGRSASSARRRCSTRRSSVSSPRPWAASASSAGTGSDEPLAAAALALEAGELVAMMPEGTIPRGPAFFDPVLKGRWGAARLAAMTGAPVIPVGLWGTEKVWPRSERLPNLLALGHPPTVTIRVGKAVAGLAGTSPDADTKKIMTAITKLLPARGAQEAHAHPRGAGSHLPGRQDQGHRRGQPETRHRLSGPPDHRQGARMGDQTTGGVNVLAPHASCRVMRAARLVGVMTVVLLVLVVCGGDDATRPTTTTTGDTTSTSLDPMASPSVDGKFAVDATGRELALRCWGSGTPVVVFDPGSSAPGIASWAETPMVRELAQRTQVCAYDRAGLGASDDAPDEPRVLDDVVEDLHSLLPRRRCRRAVRPRR